MTGPEHYREAVELLRQITNQGEMPTEVVSATCLAAQVHATLALAAATAASIDHAPEWNAWHKVTGGAS